MPAWLQILLTCCLAGVHATTSPLLRCHHGLQIDVIAGRIDGLYSGATGVGTEVALAGANAVAAEDESDSLLVADTGGTGQVRLLANASLGPGVARLMDAYNPYVANVLGIIGAAEVTAVTIPPASVGAAHPFALETRALLSDYLLGRLFALRRDGSIVPLAGSGSQSQIRDPGRRRWDGSLAVAVPLNQVTKATADPLTGRVWFAEQNSHLIRLVLPNGTLYTTAGTGEDTNPNPGCFENTPELVHLWYPAAAVWDAPRRRLLIVNSGYKCILSLADGGNWVYRLVGGRTNSDGASYADGTHALDYFLKNPQAVVVAEPDDADLGDEGTGAPGSGGAAAGGSSNNSTLSSSSDDQWRTTGANATLLISDAGAHQVVAVAPDQRVYALSGIRVVAEEEAVPWNPPFRDGTAAISTGLNIPRGACCVSSRSFVWRSARCSLLCLHYTLPLPVPLALPPLHWLSCLRSFFPSAPLSVRLPTWPAGMTYSFTQRAAFFAEFKRGVIRRLRCADAPIPTPSPVPTATASVTPLPRAQAPGFCAAGDIVVSAAVAGNGAPSPSGQSAGNGGAALAASFDGALISVALAPALPSGRAPYGFSAAEESSSWFRANATQGGASPDASLSFSSGAFGRARYAYTADRLTVRGIRLADPAAPAGSPLQQGRMAAYNILGGGEPPAVGASTGIRLGRPGNESFFSAIVRLALDVSGERLFVALDAENAVVAVSLTTGVVSAFAGRPGGPRSSAIDCTATTCLAVDALLSSAGGLAWDEPRQRLFIAEPPAKRVRYVTAQLTMQAVAGLGRSSPSSSTVGGLATAYTFVNTVESIALAPGGDMLYVTDRSTGIVAVRVTPGAPFIIAATFFLTYRAPIRLASLTVVNATMSSSLAAAAASHGGADAAVNTAAGSQPAAGLGSGVSLLITDFGDTRLLALRMSTDGLRAADGSGSVAGAIAAITPSSPAAAEDISFLSAAPAVDPITHTIYATSMATAQLYALTCALPSPSPSPTVPPSPSASRSFGYRSAVELAEAAAVAAAIAAAALDAQAAAASARSTGIAAGVLIPAVTVPILVAAVAVWLLYLRRARARRQRTARTLASLVAAQRLLALQSDLVDSHYHHPRSSARSGGGEPAIMIMSTSRGLLDGLALLAAVASDDMPLLPISAIVGDADGEAGADSTATATTTSRAASRQALPRARARGAAASRGEVHRVAAAGGGSSAVASLQAAVAAQAVRGLFAEGEAAAAAAAAAAARRQGVMLSPGRSGVARSARLSHLSTDDGDGDSASSSSASGDVVAADRRVALGALLRAMPDAEAWESAALRAVAAAAAPLAAPQCLNALLQGSPASAEQQPHRGMLLSALVDKSVQSLMVASHEDGASSTCWFDSLGEETQHALAAPELASLCSAFLTDQYGSLQLGDAALPSTTAAVPLPLLLQAAVARNAAAAPAAGGGTGSSPSSAVANIALHDWQAARRSARASRRSKRSRPAARSSATDDGEAAVAVEVGYAESSTTACASDDVASAAIRAVHSGGAQASSGAVETVLLGSSAARRTATASASPASRLQTASTATTAALDIRSRARAAVEALVLLSLSSAARTAGQALVRTVAADAAAGDVDDADTRNGAGAALRDSVAGGSSLDLALRVEILLHSRSSRVSAAASTPNLLATGDRRRSGRRSKRSSSKHRHHDDASDDEDDYDEDAEKDSVVDDDDDHDNDDDVDDDASEEASSDDSDAEASEEDAVDDVEAAAGSSRASTSSRRASCRHAHARASAKSRRDRLASDNPLHKRDSAARRDSAERARQRIHDLLSEQLGGLTALALSSDRAARRTAWDSAVASVANSAVRVLCCCCLRCGCCHTQMRPRVPAYEPALVGRAAHSPRAKQRKWSEAAPRESARPGTSLQALLELHQRGGGSAPAAGLDVSSVSPLVLMLARAKGLSLDASSPSTASAKSTSEPGLPMTAEQQRRMRVALAARQQQQPAAALHHHHQAALALQAASASAAGTADSLSTSTVTFINSPLLPYVAARAPGTSPT